MYTCYLTWPNRLWCKHINTRHKLIKTDVWLHICMVTIYNVEIIVNTYTVVNQNVKTMLSIEQNNMPVSARRKIVHKKVQKSSNKKIGNSYQVSFLQSNSNKDTTAIVHFPPILRSIYWINISLGYPLIFE